MQDKEILERLSQGEICLYPTDTIWGIGCLASKANAIKRLFELKQRAFSKPALLLVSDIEMLRKYIDGAIDPQLIELHELAKQHITVIHRNTITLSPLVQLNQSETAFRICKHAQIKELISRSKEAWVSTSANIAGAPFPTGYQSISAQLKAKVDFSICFEAEATQMTKQESSAPSRIVRLDKNNKIQYLR